MRGSIIIRDGHCQIRGIRCQDWTFLKSIESDGEAYCVRFIVGATEVDVAI